MQTLIDKVIYVKQCGFDIFNNYSIKDIIIFALACIAIAAYFYMIYKMVKNSTPNTWNK